MDYNIYFETEESREVFCHEWPLYTEYVIKEIDKPVYRHTVILRHTVKVLDEDFFKQIQNLLSANNYLDALRHPAWLVFGNEYVKLNSGRDYWALNLRPVVGFDDTTWCDR